VKSSAWSVTGCARTLEHLGVSTVIPTAVAVPRRVSDLLVKANHYQQLNTDLVENGAT
jgi:hypothetical protein